MDLENLIIIMDLQTFADGGAAGGEGGTATGGEAAAAGKGPSTGLEDLSQVRYGKQDNDASEAELEANTGDVPETKEKQNEAPAKKASFDDLIKGDPDYAKEMQKRIDNAINRRFAKTKAAEEQNSKLMPALNLLANKYGVQAGDTDALIDAINSDSDLIEQQAMDAGMEPDAYREYQKLKAENEAYKQAEAERARQAQVQSSYNEWTRQAAEAQRFYPNLDLRTEVQNEQFAQLLGAGIDVRTAYEVVHQEEIQSGLIQRAAADAKRETVAKIANKSNRPKESAAGKAQSSTVRADMSKFTTRDFDEIMRRAARGEKIRF